MRTDSTQPDAFIASPENGGPGSPGAASAGDTSPDAWLLERAGVCRLLHHVVARLAPHAHWTDDLMQEALIELWRLEQDSPGQSPAWYLQGCRLHLQNHLRQGRSVDSVKRSRPQGLDPSPATEEAAALSELPDRDDAGFGNVVANDMLALLFQWLTPAEKRTLACLLEGLSHREIASVLEISHTMVARHRRNIALLAAKLGIAPPGAQNT